MIPNFILRLINKKRCGCLISCDIRDMKGRQVKCRNIIYSRERFCKHHEMNIDIICSSYHLINNKDYIEYDMRLLAYIEYNLRRRVSEQFFGGNSDEGHETFENILRYISMDNYNFCDMCESYILRYNKDYSNLHEIDNITKCSRCHSYIRNIEIYHRNKCLQIFYNSYIRYERRIRIIHLKSLDYINLEHNSERSNDRYYPRTLVPEDDTLRSKIYYSTYNMIIGELVIFYEKDVKNTKDAYGLY